MSALLRHALTGILTRALVGRSTGLTTTPHHSACRYNPQHKENTRATVSQRDCVSAEIWRVCGQSHPNITVLEVMQLIRLQWYRNHLHCFSVNSTQEEICKGQNVWWSMQGDPGLFIPVKNKVKTRSLWAITFILQDVFMFWQERSSLR